MVETMSHPIFTQQPIVQDQAVLNLLAQLQRGHFFKLICGGSFTEVDKIAHLATTYTLAGTDCIDLAADLSVLQTVESVLKKISQPHPIIMVSVPLDPDPHFRKIELTESDCIQCGLCLPECPTEAITLPDSLKISQALCYGCGRCIPTCPTNALSLLPFQVESQIENTLRHPLVKAVEIHSHYVDPYMLATFLTQWHPLLKDKLLSLCFRIDNLPFSQILEFYQTASQASSLPVMLQIDGIPMSGNDDPEASRPSLEAAVQVIDFFKKQALKPPAITISGGINQNTAQLLKESRYHDIAGVGMGTVARKAIWTQEGKDAVETATQLITRFRTR
jgi:ferredoxin